MICLFSLDAQAQLDQIHRDQLPQTNSIQQAYSALLPIEQYARSFQAKWLYPVPKEEVVSKFSFQLRVLEVEQQGTPANLELKLLTGLVAHQAYNLDIQSAYEPAMTLLGEAEKLAPQDPRPGWFLAVHQCQSNDPPAAMKRFVSMEDKFNTLPSEFWFDYAMCAHVAFMPVHAVKGLDKAGNVNEDDPIVKLLRGRIRVSDPAQTYKQHDAWSAERQGDSMRFTSNLCGLSFTTKSNDSLQVEDVAGGRCLVLMNPPAYKAHHGKSSPTIALMTHLPESGQTLDKFVRSMLDKPAYREAQPTAGLPCPVSTCIEYEIINKTIYAKQGGGHFLIIAFESKQPKYPGLRFEVPASLPKDPSMGGPQYFRPSDVLRRFDGTIFNYIMLDANEEIFAPARIDLETILKSVEVDTQ